MLPLPRTQLSDKGRFPRPRVEPLPETLLFLWELAAS